MHDLIFANQPQMAPEKYVEYAQQLGLNLEKFKRDVASAEIKKRIDDDNKDAASVGITGTPGFLINGKFVSGAKPFEAFKPLIDAELGPGAS